MPRKLLRQIAASHLPITFYRPDDIEEVRMLCSEGMVIALFPSASDSRQLRGNAPAAAEVLAVTQKGLEDLADFSYPSASQEPAKPWLGARIASLVNTLGADARNAPARAGRR
ncbi:hypothetical protein [Variovorax defluvii]